MNTLRIIGVLKQDFRFYYEYKREVFYINYIECERTSGAIDILPLVISELVAPLDKFKVGDVVEVIGEVRTRNDNGRVRVFMFASDIYKSSEPDTNEVKLEGFICKDPIYRTTPLGREITDMIVAVNRRNGTDFLPVIAWGRNARRSELYRVGDKIELEGRLQSRDYGKGVAYEISVIEISASETN